MSKPNLKKRTLTYLNNLTKEELIELVLKFAPKSFFENINSQFASQDEAMNLLKEVSRAINTLLSDEETLYNPREFEHELLKQLEKIRGLWDKLPLQIGDLIIKIIEDIEQAFEDGYLYIENYHKEDEYFESEDVNDYILHFVSNFPKDIKSNYVEKLRNIFCNFGYSTFSSVEKQLS